MDGTREEPNVSAMATAQTVSRRLPTAEALILAGVSPCGLCGGQGGSPTSFLRVLFSSVTISPLLLHTNNVSSGGWALDR